MKRLIPWTRKPLYSTMVALIMIFAASKSGIGSDTKMERQPFSGYEKWEIVGRLAAETSLSLMREKVSGVPQKGSMVVMTNAGYAEVNGASTQGALDGLISVTGASRGRNTLIEIHSASWQPLWFAVYDKGAGFCTYLEIDSGATPLKWLRAPHRRPRDCSVSQP